MTHSNSHTLDDYADVRSGDKGDTLIVAVFPRINSDINILTKVMTPERVAEHYSPLVRGPVERRVVSSIPGIVFRLPGVLSGGATGSLHLDGHGKTLGYHMLSLPIE